MPEGKKKKGNQEESRGMEAIGTILCLGQSRSREEWREERFEDVRE